MSDVKFWTQNTPIGDLTIVSGDTGVRGVYFPGESHTQELLDSSALEERQESVADQLDQYFRGDLKEFSVPVDLSSVSGTFHKQVLETLFKDVKYGETVSYAELAAMAGSPLAARAVGEAMRKNPVPIIVPCHRVVASSGIGGYMNGYQGGLDVKRWLLKLEGAQLAFAS